MSVLWERESPRRFAAPPLTRGALEGGGHPGSISVCLSRGPPHPPPSGAPSPLEGEGWGRAARVCRPYGGKRTGDVGSDHPGVGMEPQQRQFLQTQGPVAREEFRPATQILRAGNFLPNPRGNPRNGGPGVRRIWTRSVHPEPSPGDSLVTFSSLRKSLAVRRRRNFSAHNAPKPKAALSFAEGKA